VVYLFPQIQGFAAFFPGQKGCTQGFNDLGLLRYMGAQSDFLFHPPDYPDILGNPPGITTSGSIRPRSNRLKNLLGRRRMEPPENICFGYSPPKAGSGPAAWAFKAFYLINEFMT